MLEKHSSLVFNSGWPDMPQVSRYSCEPLLSIPGYQSVFLANLHHKRRISKQKMAVLFDPSLVKQQIVTASVLAEKLKKHKEKTKQIKKTESLPHIGKCTLRGCSYELQYWLQTPSILHTRRPRTCSPGCPACRRPWFIYGNWCWHHCICGHLGA